MRILSLGPESFGGFAGIAQGTRDFLSGLLRAPSVDEIRHFARKPADGGPATPDGIVESVCAGSGLNYGREALRIARTTEFDLVFCLHINLMPVAAMIGWMHKKPIWMVIHGIDAWTPPRELARRASVSRADLVTASSRYTRERFLDWAPLDPDRVRVNTNPVHLEDWNTAEIAAAGWPKPEILVERYELRGKRVLLTLGQMRGGDRHKGHDEILAALPEVLAVHSDLVWLVVGDGPDRPRIEARVRAMGLEKHVRFAGRIPETEKEAHYRVADAYALPSKTEGFGIAYLEAAACGLPVLGSRLDGSRDALLDGELGLLVDPDDQAALRNGLVELLSRPKAVPPCLERHGFGHMAERMQALLASPHLAKPGQRRVA